MNITIINDCRDDNAAGRQTVRAQALLGGSASFIGVMSDLEAAGNMVDAIDAYGDMPGVVLVNVAPRSGKAQQWENGTPFCYFRYRDVLVIASIDGYTLSLVKKLDLVSSVFQVDVSTAAKEMVAAGVLTDDAAAYLSETQFRSYDFVPRLAAHLQSGYSVPAETIAIDTIPDAPTVVWWVDNFGNCKTTLLAEELAGVSEVEMTCGTLPYAGHLHNVADDTLALVAGSSGLGGARFIEVVRQGGSAAADLTIASGYKLYDSSSEE